MNRESDFEKDREAEKEALRQRRRKRVAAESLIAGQGGEEFFGAVLQFWQDTEKGYLTKRQLEWCEVWQMLTDLFIMDPCPSLAALPLPIVIAEEMGITKQASGKMKERIIEKLRPVSKQHAADRETDERLEEAACRKEEWTQKRPEYLERSERRGRVRWLHFQAAAGFDERLGRETVSGYHIREVSEAEAAALETRGVPVVRRRWKTHKESPLARWWIAKARELTRERGCGYTEALRELYRLYAAARPPEAKGTTRCIVCRQPLPWGETIPGSGMGRITARREFCSNFCRTTFKRARR